jgi:hypothetical protein
VGPTYLCGARFISVGPTFMVGLVFLMSQCVRLTVLGQASLALSFLHIRTWWAKRGSNPRQPPCKGGALPTELFAREV